MTILFLIVGILLPTTSGWLVLRLLEGKSPVLFRGERWVMGCVLGLTFTMELTFLMHIAGLISFTRIGFLSVQIILTVLLGILFFWRKPKGTPPSAYISAPLSRIGKVLALVLGLLVVAKLVSSFVILTSTPIFFDDEFKNWNMRGKLFYVTHELTLDVDLGDERISAEGLGSYPPALPMIKTWLATLEGKWNEPLVNSVQFVWVLGILALLFFALRRLVSLGWSLAGVDILASIPIFIMHSTASYAEIFLAVHIFISVSMLFFGLQCGDSALRSSLLRISALALGLLVFTKNEALLIYVPSVLLILILSLFFLRKHQQISMQEIRSALLAFALSLAILALPWILFKWTHGLTFGNAKAATGFAFGWQPEALKAIWTNTFLEGNWLLLFPLLFALILSRCRRAFRPSLTILIGFFFLVYFGQLFLYLFTSLSTEAVNQTGYARGLLHIVPVGVLIGTALLSSTVSRRD